MKVCRVCEARFHSTDQNRTQQKNQECPICGHNDVQEITPKVCRVLSIGRTELQLCIHEYCNSWNEYFQMCSMEIPGYLNAREEERARTEEAERKAYHEGGFNER